MNNKHLLVKCLTLLFQSSQLPNKSDTSSTLVEQALEHVKLPEVVTGLETERELLQNLMKTIKNLLKHPNEKISATELYQQIIVDCADDIAMREAIQAGLVTGLSEEEIHNLCATIRRDLNQFLRDEKGKQILLNYADQVRFKSSELEDLPKVFFSLSSELEPYYTNSQEDDPAVVASFGIGDKKAIVDVFAKIKERNEGRGGMRFGFRGINRFFKGTIEEGKCVVIGALQHQHKTGFSLALFRQLLMYNIPIIREWEVMPNVLVEAEKEIRSRYQTDDAVLDEVLQNALDEELRGLFNRQLPYTEEEAIFYDDPNTGSRVPVRMHEGKDPFMGGKPKRIPCMIRISTEDEIEDNMEKLYRDIYGNVHGKAPDMRLVSDADMEEYLSEQLGRNGWYAHFMRVNPSEWTYQNIIQTVLDLEAKGYEVRTLMIDYLPMIPTTGCEQGPAGHDLRDLYRRIRNFASA